MNIFALINSLPGAVAQGLIWGIMAMGVFVSYKVLDYADLTVDNSLCTGGAIAAICIVGGMDPIPAMLLATLAGALAGMVTGLLHTVLGIPAILSGILTQLALYSINMHIMGKSNITVSRTQYDLLLTSAKIPSALLVAAIIVGILVCVVYCFFGTEIGCALRATGNNEAMARAQGINTNHIKVIGLMLSNALVGLSGALLTQYQGNVDINMGRGAIVIGLAAVVIGRAIRGRYKNYAMRLLSTALGAVVYYVILAVVVWAGLSTMDLKLFSAVVVTVFLSVPYLKRQMALRHPHPVKKEAA